VKEPSIQTGYLVLADLAGFTPFVASAEVDHAQVILANLLGLLRNELTPALQLAEVEGDALFLFAPHSRMARGETLLELIESTYVAFRDRQRTMARNASCPCEACRMIPSLDLKFVAHAGEFVLQNLTGTVKPFGSCVNLAHRLLKNDVTESTGWPAYALFTDQALDMMGVRPDSMHTQTLSYAHHGEIAIGAIDLRQRFTELTAERTAFLPESEAHFTIRRRYAVPRPLLWELLTDIDMRNKWEIGSDWSTLRRPTGRAGPGTTNHCAASDFIEEVLDWRPFDYYTALLRYRAVTIRVTGELRAEEDATELRWSLSLDSFVPRPLRGPACRFFATRLMRAPARFEKLDQLIAAGAARAESAYDSSLHAP
jgi:hypothetical protein